MKKNSAPVGVTLQWSKVGADPAAVIFTVHIESDPFPLTLLKQNSLGVSIRQIEDVASILSSSEGS